MTDFIHNKRKIEKMFLNRFNNIKNAFIPYKIILLTNKNNLMNK